ncbi:MAG: choice-of-anchor L domain-containing protein [Bacteroidia bacterium]
MLRFKHKFLLLCASVLLAAPLQAQLFVDNQGYTAQSMVTDFFDSTCVTISNVTFTGDSTQIGFFDGSLSNIGLNAGLILSSGDVYLAAGPNDQGGATAIISPGAGDLDLDGLTSVSTWDAAVLELDLVPSVDTVFFKYVFGSEEFLEFVGSFNDVFAFFISGPKPSGGSYVNQNIALVPNTTDYVSINNVNTTTNSAYYVNNGDGSTPTANPTVQYDGFTTVMTASAPVVIGQTYHVKIAVADALDRALDSGVFLSVESLCGDGMLVLNANGNATMNGNTASFRCMTPYASRFFWDFGDGTNSAEKNPVHTYSVMPPQGYDVTLITSNYMDTDTFTFKVGATTNLDNPIKDVCNLYPNPTKDKLQLELINTPQAEVLVRDIYGKTIFAKTITQNEVIDLTQVADGVYLLSLKANGNIYTTKVIKE